MQKNERTEKIFLAHLKSTLLSPVDAIIGYCEIALEDAAAGPDPFLTRDILRVLHAGKDLHDYVQHAVIVQSSNSEEESSTSNEQHLSESSHAIRTYLTQISGYCEMLIEELEESINEFSPVESLKKIHAASLELLNSIDDILNFSRLQTRLEELDADRVASDNIAQSLVQSITQLSTDNEINITGNILVVDEMESNRDILAMRLSRSGHTTATAGSGHETLKMLEESDFDLVIMDVMMPGLNGYQVMQKIAEIPSLKNVAIIVHSPIDEIDTIVRCLEMGAEDYLIKPSNMTVLHARINSCLEKKYLIDSERRTAEKLAEKQAQLTKELSEAADYVTSIIPEPFTTEHVAADWRFYPSSLLSGDSLGYHWIDDAHFACYLVDVCGHGIGAALLSVSAINTLNTSLSTDMDTKNPSEVLSALNQIYSMESQGGKYFTMWYGVYNKDTHTLHYACAGHPPAVLIQGESREDLAIELLDQGGGPITGFESDYQSGLIELKTLNQLYIFSDGIYEVEMPDGHMLAHSEFVPMMMPQEQSLFKSLDQIIDMMQQVTDKPTDDDVSLMSFSFAK